MIQYLQHKSIDKKKWDRCIDNSLNGYAYVYSWYLDAVCTDWTALILNDYEAVFPMAENSKFKINYLYQPFFTRYFGIYSPKTISQNLVKDFFNAIPLNIKFIEFNIHECNEFNLDNFQKKERFFQFLNLNRAYEDISKEYKGDAKRNLNKAEKKNNKITETVASEDIVNLFKKNKGRQLKEIKASDYVRLHNIMEAANENNCGISLGVTNKNNDLIAAAFFIKSNHRILFLKGSANKEGKASGAMYLIIDSILRNYALKADFFDFGGSSLESIASFNHNFGAKNCVYLQVKKNSLPYIIKQISGKK